MHELIISIRNSNSGFGAENPFVRFYRNFHVKFEDLDPDRCCMESEPETRLPLFPIANPIHQAAKGPTAARKDYQGQGLRESKWLTGNPDTDLRLIPLIFSHDTP